MSRAIGLIGVVIVAIWLWTGVATASGTAGSDLQQAIATNQEPAVASADAQISAQITDLRAIPARKRGRIELSWHYTGRPFAGAFVVERSTNGSSWRSVSACNIAFEEDVAAYGCTDASLRSGATYAYRACAVTRGTACTAAIATRAVSVKAP